MSNETNKNDNVSTQPVGNKKTKDGSNQKFNRDGSPFSRSQRAQYDAEVTLMSEDTRTRKVLTELDTDVDLLTGEILNQRRSTKTINVDTEPDYIKLYLDTMLVFNGLKDIDSQVIIAFCKYMTYSNKNKAQMISVNKLVKEEIADSLGVKESTVSSWITKLVKGQVFMPSGLRGTYYVNPFIIGRGQWGNIKALRAQFDFRNGIWEVTKQIGTNDPNDNNKANDTNNSDAKNGDDQNASAEQESAS